MLRELMRESPVIQELVCEELQKDILHILHARFGQLPAYLADRVHAILNLEVIRSLLVIAGTCSNLGAFQEKLPVNGGATAQVE